MANMKILIGGGTGFIGRHLGELVSKHGYDVLNISRMPGRTNINWSEIAKKGLPENTQAVVNLAGQQTMDFTKGWTPGFKQNIHNSRVFTTKTLVDAINKSAAKPKVCVVITGVGAYEPSESNKYDESSPVTGTDFFSKLTVEWEGATSHLDKAVRLVIIRSGVVIGRDGGMIKNMIVPFFFGLGGRIGSGKQYLPWIHVDDLTGMIKFAIENDQVEGILNGVAPQVVTNQDFTTSFAKALNRPAFLPTPEFALNYLLHPERAMLLTKGQHVTPKRVLEYGFKSFAKALNRPAFFPVPETILNIMLNPERAMLLTKGQHVTPKRVIDLGYKYKYTNIDEACQEVAYLMPKSRN